MRLISFSQRRSRHTRSRMRRTRRRESRCKQRGLSRLRKPDHDQHAASDDGHAQMDGDEWNECGDDQGGAANNEHNFCSVHDVWFLVYWFRKYADSTSAARPKTMSANTHQIILTMILAPCET